MYVEVSNKLDNARVNVRGSFSEHGPISLHMHELAFRLRVKIGISISNRACILNLSVLT